MTSTTRLGLPLLAAAQAQKHVTHNEALVRLDDLVQAAVESRMTATPPASPDEGVRYIVGDSATGLWSGHEGDVAVFRDDAWQFYPPWAGFTAYAIDEGKLLYYDGEEFGVIEGGDSETQNLEFLGLRTTADSTNPLSAKINKALFAATTITEGGTGDLRYTLSKETAANILSFLFQTNYSGRAEFGLTGDDNFHIKTSADGTTFHEALCASKTNGSVTFPSGVANINGGAVAGLRNYLINGSGLFWQRGLLWSTIGNSADDLYGFDRWNNLCQTTSATNTVTFTNGSANIGWTSHNRVVGDCFRLTTTGTLPTNFATATTYYVVSVVNANTITVSSYPGGAAITAGSAGSGTHTATAPSLTLSQVADAENTTPTMMRLTSNVSTSQRFGLAQIIESCNCKDLRGQTVTLSARVRSSNSTTLRYAILEWTGTVDSVTSDVINDWTSGTFTAGNFFLSSNLTVTATGSTALTANTLTSVSLSATLGSSLNNAIVLFWTDSAQVQNSTLDIGKAQFETGPVATPFELRPTAVELILCQRYLIKNFGGYCEPVGNGGWSSTTNACVQYQFPFPMRASPTMTATKPTAFQILSGGTFLTSISAIAALGGSNLGGILYVTASGATSGASASLSGCVPGGAITFDAEL